MNLDELTDLFTTRRDHWRPTHSQMTLTRQTYESKLSVVLPEIDDDEAMAIANLLRTGIDGTAQRIASTLPSITYPPTKAGQKRAEDQARQRRLAAMAWWQEADMTSLLSLRARHYLAYGMSPVMLRPDNMTHGPAWDIRDPLTALPAPTINATSVVPDNMIFTYRRPLHWLLTRYPATAGLVGANRAPDTMFDLIEYADHEVFLLAVLAQAPDPRVPNDLRGLPSLLLEQTPNRAGIPVCTNASRLTLHKPNGAYDGVIPMMKRQAKLDALEYIAIEQGVFPRSWLEANPNEIPEIITQADGRKGIVGVVKGGRLREENLNPGYKTSQAIDRLSDEMRVESNQPSTMQGVAPTNQRTARQTDAILSAAIDFGIQESQRVFERALQAENEIAATIAKTYYGRYRQSFYLNLNGTKATVDYQAADIFDSTVNTVRYSLAGTDLNAQVVRGGQLLGAKAISLDTYRKMNPEIDDPDHEAAQIVIEQVQQTFLAGVASQVQSGSMNLADTAEFLHLVESKRLTPVEAFRQVQAAAQSRQATNGEPGTPEAPAEPGSPAAQPGVAPGAQASIPPPSPDQNNLAAILQNAGQARQAIYQGSRP